MTTKTFYITTAIDYANSTPHLGTAYEKIGADVIARYKRHQGFDVHFQMGNDEHSQNVRKKAEELNLDPKTYCDQMAAQFIDTWNSLHISFDNFIQTSEQRHHQTVRDIAQRIYDKGYIFKSLYEGLYCVSCEAFYQEKDLENDLCPNHKTKPEVLKEENYFFRLSAFASQLKELFATRPDFLLPSSRRNEILSLLDKGLEDISISRPSKGWGIRLPFDETAVAYVWFDALINYISALGDVNGATYQKYWPANLHVIGKDITRFHSVVWPAMLMAAGLEVPQHVWGHGFVSLRGEKMSKSRGNIADPLQLAQNFGADIIRFHLMREVPWDQDGDFSEERVVLRYNADLANNFGNLLSRSISMSLKYFSGKILLKSDDLKKHTDFQRDVKNSIDIYFEKMDSYEPHLALEALFSILNASNKLIADHAPWTLAKTPEGMLEAQTILYLSLESLRMVSVLLKPFMPELAANVLSKLGVHNNKLFSKDDPIFTKQCFELSPLEAVFPRLDLT